MSRKTDALLADPDFAAAINSAESLRPIAQRYGVSFGFVQKARAEGLCEGVEGVEPATVGDSREESSDGRITIEKKADRIIPLSEWLDDLRRDGYNPDDYTTSHRHSVWTQHTAKGITKTLYSNAFSAVKKPVKELAATARIDWEAASKFVEGFTYIPAKRDFLVDTAILQPTDEQWGKTDFDGGTPQTEERVMNSYAAFADYVREYRPRQAFFARTGDGIENFCNTPSQRDTNDLDLPAMITQSFKMDLAGTAMIAPLVQELVEAYVPSNHSRWRTGAKADAGNAHADFGLTVANQLRAMQSLMGILPNVKILTPEPHMESMTVQLDTLRAGLVHGHQTNSPDKIGEWWKGQDHGRMPTWDADILFVGHFHSLRIYQSGDGRWIVVGPASDNGSSWFSNLKGERARSGMLAMAIEGKRWRFQEIL